MMEDGLIPRITIPGQVDRETVISALVHYSHMISAKASRSGDVVGMVVELRLVLELIEEILDAMKDDASARLEKLVGEGSEEFGEALDEFLRGIQQNPDEPC